MNRVRQPRTLFVLGLNAEMGTAAGADELVEIPTGAERPHRIKAHPLTPFIHKILFPVKSSRPLSVRKTCFSDAKSQSPVKS